MYSVDKIILGSEVGFLPSKFCCVVYRSTLGLECDTFYFFLLSLLYLVLYMFNLLRKGVISTYMTRGTTSSRADLDPRRAATYRIAGNFQNFAIFSDRSASAKRTAKIAASAISIAPRLPVRARAAKISSDAIARNFAPAKISRSTVRRVSCTRTLVPVVTSRRTFYPPGYSVLGCPDTLLEDSLSARARIVTS